jgi:hypothetical protein
MKEVFFKADGSPLVVKAVFRGNMIANYELFLREKNSNSQTSILSGDNQNPENDATILPTPALVNDGRRIVLETGFKGLDPDQFPDYAISLEVYQDEQLLGADTEEGALAGKGQYSILFIRLTGR